MKKLNRLYLFLLLGLFLFPKVVGAVSATGSIVLDCSSETFNEKQEDVTCSLRLEIPDPGDKQFKTISFKLSEKSVGSSVTIETVSDDYVVSGTLSDGYSISVKNNGTFTNNTTIAIVSNITIPVLLMQHIVLQQNNISIICNLQMEN